MRQVITGERVAAFVAERCRVNIVPPYVAVGVERDGLLVNGVVFNHFTGHDVHVSVGGGQWSKGMLADVGHYVFTQLGCGRITAITEQPGVVALANRLGGKVEGVMRNHFGPGRDAFVVGILKEDWTF